MNRILVLVVCSFDIRVNRLAVSAERTFNGKQFHSRAPRKKNSPSYAASLFVAYERLWFLSIQDLNKNLYGLTCVDLIRSEMMISSMKVEG